MNKYLKILLAVNSLFLLLATIVAIVCHLYYVQFQKISDKLEGSNDALSAQVKMFQKPESKHDLENLITSHDKLLNINSGNLLRGRNLFVYFAIILLLNIMMLYKIICILPNSERQSSGTRQ